MWFRFTGSLSVKILKWTAMLLPILSILYMSLADTWGWPYAMQITATCAAVETAALAIIGKIKPDEAEDIIQDGETLSDIYQDKE